MIVAIAGASGLIGAQLTADLKAAGHRVRPLLRPSSPPAPDGIRWDPSGGTIQVQDLEGVDVVVNLAGTSIGASRWTRWQKRDMYESRVRSTALLANTIAAMEQKPSVFAVASASGYYGPRNDEVLDEASGRGEGFLAELVEAWEAAAEPARQAGVRTLHFRSGLVLSPHGGLLAKLVPVFKMGLGGKLGFGKQWMSWITLEDEARAMVHLIEKEECSGPFNLCSPNPIPNDEFTATLARVLHRPSFFAVPAFALTLFFGAEPTREAFLSSQRMTPAALTATGFQFRHLGLERALREVLNRAA